MPVPIDELEAEARRAFAFLESEFGCELERSEGERRSCRLQYRCETGFADIHLAEPALRGDTSGYEGLEEAFARRAEANERDVQGRIRQISEDRGSEGSLRRALRRLWGRIP